MGLRGQRFPSYQMDNRYFGPVKGTSSLLYFVHFAGYDTAYGSHTFHQINMHYPMRVLVTKDYQLLHNMEYKMPYEIASDIYQVTKRLD